MVLASTIMWLLHFWRRAVYERTTHPHPWRFNSYTWWWAYLLPSSSGDQKNLDCGCALSMEMVSILCEWGVCATQTSLRLWFASDMAIDALLGPKSRAQWAHCENVLWKKRDVFVIQRLFNLLNVRGRRCVTYSCWWSRTLIIFFILLARLRCLVYALVSNSSR